MQGREAYRNLIAAHQELFTNPPDAPFEILTDEVEIKAAELAKVDELRADPNSSLEWARVGIAFMDQYLLILRDAVRFRGSGKDNTVHKLGTYVRAVQRDPTIHGVVTLPVWREHVLLIDHFRHATRSWHLEIPRGFGLGSDSVASARQELEEEIGATVAQLILMGQSYPDSGAGSGCVDIFYAELVSYAKPELQEGIRAIVPTSIPDFEHMIRDGALTDGFLLTAYGLAKARGLL